MASDENTPAPATPVSPRWLAVLAGLGLIGLGVSLYLSFVTGVLGVPPAGCGDGSACGEVLGSPWSKLFLLPVSLPATLMYVAMLAALRWVNARSAAARCMAWSVLLVGSSTALAAAVWFSYLQLAKIGAVCIYCTVDHLAGVLFGVVTLCLAFGSGKRRSALGEWLPCRTGMEQGHKFAAVGAGVLLAAGVALGQTFGPMPAPARANVNNAADADAVASGMRRSLTLLGGQLKVELPDEPFAGRADAPRVLALMYDYCCPHCKHVHAYLPALREQLGGELAVVFVPTPLGRKCNKHVTDIPAFFEQGCDLAKLSLAVWRAAPERWPAYDAWLFDVPPKQPRSPEAARAKAIELVGEAALDQALSDPAVDAILQKNIQAYGEAHGGRLPMILAPGVDPIIGDVYDDQALVDFVNEQK